MNKIAPPHTENPQKQKEPEQLSYAPKRFVEERKVGDSKSAEIMHPGQQNYNPFNTELMSLQMPNHKSAVPVNDTRPESKKGHDLMSKEQLAKMTRESTIFKVLIH